MKLHKVLTINGQPFEVVSDEVRLDLHTPGRASFRIKSATAQRGLVCLDIGYNDKPLQRHFLGYIEQCTAANGLEQVLFCRELTATLSRSLPLGLRHVDLPAVLSEITRSSCLRFRLPATGYAKVRVPYFYSLGTGVQALDSLGRVFSIPDFIWHQQGDGDVYVGSWADSYWGTRPALQLPAELFGAHLGNQSAEVAALPGVRPGALIDQGRITSVTLADTKMVLKWKKS
ncbi:hypothetical protein BJN42_26680 [Pseudomonas koreensis]|jgi:hypothetical protein|uniref:hypothetical protein n=1 Tax=Pseudomonas sp. GXM4 TaxID=2651867 RepID=UPI0008D358D5|nr:hypothetical protein [Pseudomonas sp. GXM4]KAB2524847.1 hypothetical protein F8N49_12115 [Pseudomonas sp. GXM4]OFJ42675.1 hypothetical protein BJN42_26680 [Pseudomonas koreensis]